MDNVQSAQRAATIRSGGDWKAALEAVLPARKLEEMTAAAAKQRRKGGDSVGKSMTTAVKVSST